MGNSIAQQTPAPTRREVIDSLKAVSDTTDLNEFIRIIKQVLEEKKSSDIGGTSKTWENNDRWTSFVTSGSKCLMFLSDATKTINDMKGILRGVGGIISSTTGAVPVTYGIEGFIWVVAMATYLTEKIEEVYQNKAEALELLTKIVDLAERLSELRNVLPEEKLKKTVMLVVQGSVMCVSQMYSQNIFSSLKTLVNKEQLKEMSNTLGYLYQDLILAVSTVNAKRLAISLLDEGTKDAFLDICWFFNESPRRYVEYIVGAQEVQSLINLGLLTTIVKRQPEVFLIYQGEERLFVEDMVRETGLSMSASTRFDDVKSFFEAAQDEFKLKRIKGLWFKEDDQKEYVLDVEHLNSMSHSLRILYMHGERITSAPSPMKFKELRYLSVDPAPQLPMKVEQLDKLSVYEGPIGPNGLNKWPKNLSSITGFQFEESSNPTGGKNHSLKELILHGDIFEKTEKRRIEWLHQLSSLRTLLLWEDVEGEETREQVCNLCSLTRLSVERWCPPSFGRLTGLTHLEIRGCEELEELPSSFAELTALEHLTLTACPKLKQLPRGLKSLKYLNVRLCENFSLGSYRNLRVGDEASCSIL